LQSLYFLNNEFVHRQADALAVRVGLAAATTQDRVQMAYRLLFGRGAVAEEVKEAARFLDTSRMALRETPLAEDQHNRSALAGLMRSLFASNEFFYVD